MLREVVISDESIAEASERPHDCKTWGHATSLDLYSWTEEPIAIVCSEYSIGRGSIVIDTNNTSGLFTNQTNGVLAFYTRQIDVEKTSELAMACSTDGGYTFAKSSSVDLFLDCSGSQGLSDPKVTWHQPSESWVMTVTPISSPTVMFYISQNLVDWTWASDFTCPDLMKRGSRLESPSLVSIPRLNSTGAEDRNHPVNPGGTVLDFGDYILLLTTSRECPWDHSSETLYFPGIFNGTHFHPTDWRADRFIDFGPDNHDTQFFFGRPDGEPVISLGAASNTHFRKPTHGEFGSHQSVSLTGPRGGYLVPGPGEGDLSYFSYPVGLGELRSQVQANFSLREESSKTIAFNGSKALVVTARFEMQPPDEATVEINLDVVFRSSSGRDRILCTIIFGTWTADFGCDRSHVHDGSLSGNPGLQQMSARQVRPLLPFHNPSVRRWELQAILDRAILETYLNGGVASGTLIFSPEALLDLIDFQTSDVPTWADLQVIVQETEAT